MKTKNKWVYGLAVAISIVSGVTFLAAKIAFERFTPVEVLAARWTIAAIVLLVLFALKAIRIDLKGKPIKKVLLLALVQPCFSALLEAYGVSMTATSESALMYALTPVMVIVISSVFLKVKIRAVTVLSVVMAFAGVALSMAIGDNFSIGGHTLGYIILLGWIIVYAVYTLVSERAASQFTAVESIFCMAIAGMIWFNTINVIQGNGFHWVTMMVTAPRSGLAVLFLSVFGSLGVFGLFNYVLAHIPSAQASTIFVNGGTITGVILGIVVQGDSWGWYTLVGLGIVGAAVVLVNLGPMIQQKQMMSQMEIESAAEVSGKEANE